VYATSTANSIKSFLKDYLEIIHKEEGVEEFFNVE
jgi:hypothetical protein